MKKKTIILLLHICLLPAAQADEQQDFLSSVAGLSLPDLPKAANDSQSTTASNTFLAPSAHRRVQAPKMPKKVKPKMKMKSLPSHQENSPSTDDLTNKKIANLRLEIQRLKDGKLQLVQQLKRQATTASAEQLTELTTLKTQLLNALKEKQALQQQVTQLSGTAKFDPRQSGEFLAMVKALTLEKVKNQQHLLHNRQLETQREKESQRETEEVNHLKKTLADVEKQNLSLTEKLSEKPAVWEAKSSVDKQSWALGRSLASNVRKTILQLRDLAIPYSLEGVKQGMLAGISASKPPEKPVQNDLGTLLKRYDAELDVRTRKSIDFVRSQLKTQKIAKQNFSTFFVNVKKGKPVDAPGDVLFTLKSETFEGKKIDDVKDKPLNLNAPMPDVILEALDEIGQGGSMQLYCLGADLYNDRTLPAEMYPYTPIKISLSTR